MPEIYDDIASSFNIAGAHGKPLEPYVLVPDRLQFEEVDDFSHTASRNTDRVRPQRVEAYGKRQDQAFEQYRDVGRAIALCPALENADRNASCYRLPKTHGRG